MPETEVERSFKCLKTLDFREKEDKRGHFVTLLTYGINS
jgi:hypothetical protein